MQLLNRPAARPALAARSRKTTAPRALFGKAAEVSTNASNFHELAAPDVDKVPVAFKALEGKTVMVVNVASKCGLTAGNYKEMAELLKKYPSDKFVIMGYPCNLFGGQEPGSNAQVKEFAGARGFSGPGALLMDKANVNGADASPVYNYLKVASGDTSDIGWNFAKFLVRPDGTVAGRYAPTQGPLSMQKDIDAIMTGSK